MHSLIPLTFVAVSVFFIISPSNAIPGDQIFTQCQTIHYTILGQDVALNDACITLTEGDNCNMIVRASVGGNVLFEGPFDSQMAPQVCGTFYVAQIGRNCQMCFDLSSNTVTNQTCVVVIPSCGISLPSKQIGCFPNSKLDFIAQCKANTCPNRCTNHGQCINGVCTCDAGYYSIDCNSTVPFWEKCLEGSEFTGDVCVRLQFAKCQPTADVVVVSENGEEPIYSQAYRANQFAYFFGKRTCVERAMCDLCLDWTDFTMNDTHASACGFAEFSCSGTVYQKNQLGCFEDNQLIPDCFKCPNGCSGQGTCSYGNCMCFPGYDGDDCSVQIGCQATQCNGHGKCTNNRCQCYDGYAGEDCATYIGREDKDGNHHVSQTGAALITLGTMSVIALLGLLGWCYVKQKKNSVPRFSHFDLLENDSLANELQSEDSEQEMDSPSPFSSPTSSHHTSTTNTTSNDLVSLD